jgi:hypothetical protein
VDDTAPKQKPEQLLPGMAEQLALLGADTLPEGFSKLTRKQQHLVLEFVATGNQTEAARRAGYADPASEGSKAMRSPAVAAVMLQLGKKVAADADQLIRRVSERSRTLHALYEAERDKPATLRNEVSLLKLAAAVDKTDALLGTLLGKVSGIHLTGTINHHHGGGMAVTVPESALGALAQMRRDVVTQRLGQPATLNAGGAN